MREQLQPGNILRPAMLPIEAATWMAGMAINVGKEIVKVGIQAIPTPGESSISDSDRNETTQADRRQPTRQVSVDSPKPRRRQSDKAPLLGQGPITRPKKKSAGGKSHLKVIDCEHIGNGHD
jgi:hypothetical protein